MGNYFGPPDPPQTGELKRILKQRNSSDKMLSTIGSKFFKQWTSGTVTQMIRDNFINYLYRIDQTHQALLNFLKVYLTDEDILFISINARLNLEITNLKNKFSEFKNNKQIEKESYESVIKKKTKEFHEGQHKYYELKKYCEEIERNYYPVQPETHHDYNNISKQELEDNFKKQNGLIRQLQLQLAECQKDNLALVNKQAYYDSSNQKLLNQQKYMEYENETKKASEQQQQFYLEQHYQGKLQSMQQEYENKIEKLNQLLNYREQHVQKLLEQNKDEEKQVKEQQQLYQLEQNYQATLQSIHHEYENKIENLQKVLNNREQHLHNLHEQNKVLQEQKSAFELDLIRIKNEEKQAKEQQQLYHLEQKYQVKIQSVQREYENKIANLQKALNNREQHLQKLQEQNNVLQEQMSKCEADFNQDWHKLEKNYIARGIYVDKLQQILNFTTKERDTFKEQNSMYQQEIGQLNFHIKNLNNQISYLKNGQLEEQKEQPGRLVAVESQSQKQQEHVYSCDSMRQIEGIFKNTKSLETEVEKFCGTSEDKNFLHLQELLVRNIVKLDNVESDGNLDIRRRRKEVIQFVQSLLNKLKAKT